MKNVAHDQIFGRISSFPLASESFAINVLVFGLDLIGFSGASYSLVVGY